MAPIADDDVVEDLDAEHVIGLDKPPGEQNILLAGLDVPAGMVVDEDDSGGGLPHGGLECFAGMDEGGGQAPGRDRFLPDNAILGVQEDTAKLFLFDVPKPGLEIRRHVLACAQRISGQGGPLATPAQFHCSLDLRCLGGTDPLDPSELMNPRAGNAREAAEPVQKLATKVNGRAASFAGPEDDAEELGIGQFVRSLLQELLPRPLIFRPVLEVCSFFFGQPLFPRGIQVRAR